MFCLRLGLYVVHFLTLLNYQQIYLHDITSKCEGNGTTLNDYKMNQGHLIKSHRKKGRGRDKGQGKGLQLAREDVIDLVSM